MKYPILFFVVSFFFAFSSSAQNTTQDEYNYMVKGFYQTKVAGLDLKKGYYISDTARFLTQGRRYSVIFLNLRRTSDKSLAGTIAIVKSGISNKEYYLGIPAANSRGGIDLESTLMGQISNYNWDFGIRTGFLQALSEYLMILNTKNER